uniref:SJCHGC03648 protein n=1 Tax=Schistosoma japonicum TaxID=6182 RepID=Q5BSP5_SCHJA|nr:SJCHGC03648 protein [Schistosoma japonicum]
MDELEVLMDKHKPNLTSARKNLIQVLNELSIAYPKERRNIYDYESCYMLLQDNVNLKNLSESIKYKLQIIICILLSYFIIKQS